MTPGVQALRRPRAAVSRRRLAAFWPAPAAANPLPALDGLRAVAVLLVMLFHAWFKGPALGEDPRALMQSPFWSAHTAVQLFFVLSGFLLFLPYAQWLLGLRAAPSALAFWRRRALRVGPAFWISLGVLVLAGPLTLPRLGHGVAHVFFVFNFIPGSSEQFNDVYWTMAVEVQFYALLPLLAFAVAAAARRVGVPRALAALTAASLVVSALSAWIAHRYSPLGLIWYGLAGQYSVTLWMTAFAVGIVAAVVVVAVTRPAQVRLRARLIRPAGLAALVSLIVCVTLVAVPPLRRLPLLTGNDGLAFGWAFGVLILGIVLGPSWFRRPLEWRPMRLIGAISYSVYIWHMVIFVRIAPYLTVLPTAWVRVADGFVLEVALCIPVGYLSYQLTERPFLHRGRGRGTVGRAEAPTVTVVAVGANRHKPQDCIEPNVA